MTHSNHRRGSRESLESDWVLFAASGTDLTTETAKHKQFLEILMKYDPSNVVTRTEVEGEGRRLRYTKGWDKRFNSGVHEASTLEDIKNYPRPKRGGAVYTNKESVQKVVNDLVDAKLGFSVVISGIFDEVYDICEKAGIEAHTVNMSGGVLGKTSLLPEPYLLDFTTMCGHHFIADSLVKYLIDRVKRGKVSAEHAAVEISKQCTCNFFNVDRAVVMINDYIKANP